MRFACCGQEAAGDVCIASKSQNLNDRAAHPSAQSADSDFKFASRLPFQVLGAAWPSAGIASWGVGLSIQRPRPLVLRLRLHFPRAYLFVLFHVWVEGKKKSSRLAYFSRRVLARRPADQPYTLGLKEVDNISVTITIGIANAYQIQVVLLVFFSARLGRKATVRQLHAAVQAEQKAKLGAGRHIGPGG